MKTAIIIASLLISLSCNAQNYFYLSKGVPPSLPSGVKNINISDKTGDWPDYRETRLPIPSIYPALVDARTGYSVATTNIAQGVSNLCAKAVALAYDASTNYQAAVVRVTGGGKTIKDLRKSAKKNKEADAVEALTARIEMLEALLKQRGIMTPTAALGEDN